MQNHGLSVRLAVLSLFLVASLRLSVILTDWWEGNALSIQINGKFAQYSVYLHQIPDSVRGDIKIFLSRFYSKDALYYLGKHFVVHLVMHL